MKKNMIIVVSFIIAIMLVVGVLIMRKEIPYDFEIVQGDGHVWVIVTTEWVKRDITVILESKGSNKRKFLIPGLKKAVKIGELINGRTYNLSLSRNDFLGTIKYKSKKLKAVPLAGIEKYVVLLGASVGRSWDLNNLSSRIKDTPFFFGYRGLYEFDKTPLINELINSPITPNIVIIKECAAYFPRLIDPSMVKIKYWVSQLQKTDIYPILSTVVPVTKERDKEDQSKNRMESINEFNNAIRSFGESEGISVLDLQRILSTDNNPDGCLDSQFAAKDGFHLNDDAYLKLDEYIVNFLNK